MPVALSCILRILYLERLKEQREHDDRVGYRDVHPISVCTFGSVIASSRVPRSAGFAGLPPAAGLSRAADWPLVQIPTDRHTTTGTCVLGKVLFVRIVAERKRFFALGRRFFGAVMKT